MEPAGVPAEGPVGALAGGTEEAAAVSEVTEAVACVSWPLSLAGLSLADLTLAGFSLAGLEGLEGLVDLSLAGLGECGLRWRA